MNEIKQLLEKHRLEIIEYKEVCYKSNISFDNTMGVNWVCYGGPVQCRESVDYILKSIYGSVITREEDLKHILKALDKYDKTHGLCYVERVQKMIEDEIPQFYGAVPPSKPERLDVYYLYDREWVLLVEHGKTGKIIQDMEYVLVGEIEIDGHMNIKYIALNV